jgi:hypothetical protein
VKDGRDHGWISTRVFVAAILANLAPVIWFTFLPTRDGPTHTYTAALIRSVIVGDAGPAGDLVIWTPAPVPNWLGHAIMSVSGIIVGPWLTERVLIALIVFSIPMALRYAVRSISERPTGLEFLALPLAWGLHLHWGFYNFCLSLAMYLCSVGYWLRHRKNFGVRQSAIWAVCLVLTYFAGAQALLHVVLTVAILIGLSVDPVERIRRAVRAGVAAVPAAALFLLFVVHRPSGLEPATASPSALWASANFFRLDILRGVDQVDRFVTVAMAAAFWCLVGWTFLRRSEARWPRLGRILAVATIVDLVVLFVAPTTIGGGTLLTPREACFTLLAVILCLAVQPSRLPRPIVIAAVSMVLTCGLHVSRWTFYAEYDRAMRAFVGSAPAALEGRLFYAAPIDCEHPGRDPRTGAVCLSSGAGGYLALARQAAEVNDYEFVTNHFPLVARQRATDGPHEWATTGGALDSVVLWRGSLDQRRAAARQLFADRPIGCEIPFSADLPATLFLTSCPVRP